MFFPKSWEKVKELVEKDRIVLIKGRASVRDRVVEDDDTPAVVEVQGEEVTALVVARTTQTPTVRVRIQNAKRQDLMVMRQLFQANPGDSRLIFHIHANGKEDQVVAGFKVGISPRFLEEARAVAGRVGGSVWVE